jgi:hypothetical protein
MPVHIPQPLCHGLLHLQCVSMIKVVIAEQFANFESFLYQVSIFEAVTKIGSILKPIYSYEIKLTQISETHCFYSYSK